MEQLPSMWRTELLHPLSVHFPLALLFTGSLLFLFVVILRKNRTAAFLRPASRLLLWLGVVTAWIAVYTGNQADSEVTRSLCDPTVLELHEVLAYRMAYIFSAAVVLESLPFLVKIKAKLTTALTVIICALLIAGCGYLTYVGHLGASLVYQQAAGVYQPSDNCKEFE
ncbi:MAG TPA: DUF2231 domain-containing protein [Anseongella sp.]